MPRHAPSRSARPDSSASSAAQVADKAILLPPMLQPRLTDFRETFAAERQKMTAAQRMESRLDSLLSHKDNFYDEMASNAQRRRSEVWATVLWAIDCVIHAMEEEVASRGAAGSFSNTRELVSVPFQFAINALVQKSTLGFQHEAVRAAYANIIDNVLQTIVVPQVSVRVGARSHVPCSAMLRTESSLGIFTAPASTMSLMCLCLCLCVRVCAFVDHAASLCAGEAENVPRLVGALQGLCRVHSPVLRIPRQARGEGAATHALTQPRCGLCAFYVNPCVFLAYRMKTRTTIPCYGARTP